MFRLIILNNERVLYEGMALSVILPGAEEEVTILPFHGSLISRLRRGIITVNRSAAQGESGDRSEEADRVAIKGGIARMENNKLVILTQ